MSTSVDTKVVELKFNNDNFAEKVNLTIEQLEQLNEDIDKVGMTQALKNLTKSAKEVDVSSISDGIEEVNKGFSKMEIFAVTAMANISNSIVNLGKKLVKNLLDPIMQGGLRRAMNIEQATFQFEGMKVNKSAGNEAKSYYEEVMQAVLGTAYSYDVAAKAASQLAASNVGVEKTTRKLADGSKVEAMVMNKDMTKALLGIAGVASMTGSNFDDIAQIFTRVAGQGRVMANDLNSIASRGLNAAAVLGQALGKTEAEIRDMVSKGEVSFEMFSKAMSDAYGSHAKDSTLMFTGALEDVKAALSRIGADFYGPALTGARDFLNSLTPLVDIVHEKLNPYLEKTNNLLSTLMLRGSQALDFLSYSIVKRSGDPNDWIKENVSSYTNLMDLYNKDTKVIYNAIHGLYEYGLTIGDTTKKIRGFTMIADYLGISVDEVKKGVNEGTIGFNTFYKAFRKLYTESTELAGLFDPETGMSFGDVFDKYVVSAASAGESTERFKKHFMTLNAIIDGGQSLWESFKTILGSFGDILLTLLDHMRPLGTLFVDLVKQFAQFTVKMADFIANSGSFSKVIDTMVMVLTKLFDVLRLNQLVPNILNGIVKVFEFISAVIEKIVQGIAGVAVTIGTFLGKVLDRVREILSDAQLLSEILNDIKTAGIVVGMIRFANYLLKPLEMLEALTAAVKQTSKGFMDILKGVGDVFKGLAGLVGKIGNLINEVTDAVKRMQELIIATAVLEIAFAIAVLAGALYLLSKINANGLESTAAALISFTAIVSTIFAATKIFSEMEETAKIWEKSVNDIKDIGTAMLEFAGAVLILALSLKMLSKIKPNDMYRALFAVEALLVTLAGIAKLLTVQTTKETGLKALWSGKKTSTSMTKGLQGLIAMAAAVRIVAGALAKVASVGDPTKLYMALGAIEAIMWSMFAITKLLSGDKAAKLTKGASTLLAMAVAVRLLTKPLIELSSVDPISLGSAVLAIAALMTTMGLLTKHLSGTKGAIGAAASLLIMAEAIKVIGGAIAELTPLVGDELWQAFGMLAASVAGLVLALDLMSTEGLLTKALAFVAVAKSLQVLSGVILDLGNAGIGAWSGLGVLAVALTALWVAVWAFSKAPLGGIAKLFVTLLAGAIATAAIGAAIGVLGIGLSFLSAGLTALAGALAELRGYLEDFLAVFIVFTVALGVLAATGVGWAVVGILIGLGAAFILLGIGMQKMGDGMQTAASAIKFIAELKSELKPTAQAVKDFVDSLKGVTKDGEKIGTSLEAIAKPFRSLRKSVREVTDSMKEFTKMYDSTLGSMATYMSTLATSLKNLTKFNSESFNTATKAIRIFVDDLGNIVSNSANISSSLSGISDSMKSLADEVNHTAGAFQSLSNHGIVSLDSLGNSLRNIVSPIQNLNSLRSSFADISKDFMDFIMSLNGVKDNAYVVSEGATEIKNALDSISTAAEQAKNKFGAFTQDTANILSTMGKGFTDIAAGASAIVKVQGDLPKAAESITNFYNSLDKLGSLAGHISASTNAVADAVVALGNAAKRAVKASLGDLGSTGGELMNKLVSGIEKKADTVRTALQSAVDKAHNGVKTPANYNKWKGIGSYLIQGMVKGISSQQSSLEAEVKKLEAKAERAVEAKAKIKSPSRVWMKIGSYMGQGLAIGIAKTGTQVQSAALSLAEVSEDAVSSAILAINDAVNSDMNVDPVITPVVDLSNVRESADYISSQFNRSIMSSPYGDLMAGAINNNIQNGRHSIYKAIDDLTDKIAGMTDTMNPRQLNVYNTIDGATDPGLFADELVRSFRLNARTI